MTVSQMYQHGTRALLDQIGISQHMTQCDLQNLDDPQQVSLVAAQCTEHMINTETQNQATMTNASEN